MLAMTVPNRPFAVEPFTGMMLPDGIFEASIGVQFINAHFSNTGGAVLSNTEVYIESVSDPGIVITPQTHRLPDLAAGASALQSWLADFSLASPGAHRISFILEGPGGRRRVIKKIFVTRISFNAATGSFTAQTPEGSLDLSIYDLVRPTRADCGCGKAGQGRPEPGDARDRSVLSYLREYGNRKDPHFEFCPPGYLLHRYSATMTPNPPFGGQYGDLPFQDPWWKVVLCILGVVLLIAAAIAESQGGSGDITVTAGGPPPDGPVPNCCGVSAEGGGTSYVAAGLTAAAAAAFTAAALSDVRDPWRRGQDNTVPAPGEVTLAEKLDVETRYIGDVIPGRPFKAGVKWTYTRITSGASYTYEVDEVNENVHVATYQVKAPDVVRAYRKEPFVVQATFLNAEGEAFRGDQLFVQCFLTGPNGQWARFPLQDHGADVDDKPQDGVYSGAWFFEREKDRGLWTFFVLAQDVNHAQPDMKPEEAAQMIGGLLLTGQLTINFSGGTCPLVPDGHVNVI